MEENHDKTAYFYTSSDSDEHPLLNEKTIGDTLDEKKVSRPNGFFSRYINQGLCELLLISLAANIASSVYTVIHRGQVTLGRSIYGLRISITSL